MVARLVIALIVAAAVVGPAQVRRVAADAGPDVVALLPLAADKRLALYGRPVASELARALRDAGIEVVVVSARAPVPAHARLVVDGRISQQGGGAISIEARVRDPVRGREVASVSARAEALTSIDRAAADLAALLVPAVRTQLAALDGGPSPSPSPSPSPTPLPSPTPSASPSPSPMDTRPLAAISAVHRVRFAPALDIAAALARRCGYRPAAADAGSSSSSAPPLEIRVEILGFRIDNLGVPVGRARARVQVLADGAMRFDRVVRTDSVVGGRGASHDALARQAADQIIDVVAPRLRERLAGGAR